MTKQKKISVKELLCVFFCVGLFLSLVYISVSNFSVWHDEGYTATLIENDYKGIVERTALDVHPPLYYIVLKTWSYAFTDTVVSLRLFSAFCMLGAIIVTWLIFRKLYGIKAGLAALLAMAIGPFLVRYGQEMRMYGMVTLVASVVTWLYIKTTESKKISIRLAVAYGLTIAVGMYTQYFFVLVPMVHIIHALITNEGSLISRIVELKKYVISIVVTALLFIPWLPTVIGQFKEVQGGFWIGPVSVETLTSTPLAMTLFNKQHELIGLSGLLAVITLTTIIVVIRQFFIYRKDKVSRLLFMSVVVPPILLFLLSVPPFQPSYQDRYMSFFAPIFYGILAVGTLLIVSKKYRFALAVVLLLILAHGQYANYWDGNDHGWKKPMFTMNEIIDEVDDDSPVYSTSLWTYLDAHTTLRDRASYNSSQLLVAEYPSSWKGNWSAVYERPELITTIIPQEVQSFWLIDESGTPQYRGKELDRYLAGETKSIGYAKVTKYTRQ